MTLYHLKGILISEPFFTSELFHYTAEYLFLRAKFYYKIVGEVDIAKRFLEKSEKICEDGINQMHPPFFVLAVKISLLRSKMLMEDHKSSDALKVLWKAFNHISILFSLYFNENLYSPDRIEPKITKVTKYFTLVLI